MSSIVLDNHSFNVVQTYRVYRVRVYTFVDRPRLLVVATMIPLSPSIHFLPAGKLKPLAWSKGFVASARFLAQEFASSRSLNPIRAVVVGPPGGCQGKVCEQVKCVA